MAAKMTTPEVPSVEEAALRSSAVPSLVSTVICPRVRVPRTARPTYTSPRSTAAIPPDRTVPRTRARGEVRPRSRREVMTTMPKTVAARTSMVR